MSDNIDESVTNVQGSEKQSLALLTNSSDEKDTKSYDHEKKATESDNGSNDQEDEPGEEKKFSVTSLGEVALWPTINVVITFVLMGALIYVYSRVNHQLLDYTIAGMSPPALVALLMTITKMFLAGGIGFAVAEYKWVRLQQRETKLSVLDVYDACTRGVGGIIKVITAVKPDFVIIPTVLFQLGLIAMGPASQQILTTFSTDLCTSMFGNVFTVNNVQNQTIVDTVDISRNIHKLTEIEEDYLIPFALKRAAYHLDPPYSFICPAEALNCSYNSVPILYTVPECTQGSLQTKVVDVAAKNVTTLYDLFSYNSTMQLAILQPQLPRIYYAESMLGRTAAELDALPRVTWGTGANITLSQYIGDQSFVVATLRNTTETNYANAKDVVVLQCTLRSFSTEVTFTYDTAAQKMSWKEDRSLPLKFDYESMVTDANNVKPVYLNAYGLQISVLKHLAYDKKRDNMLFDMARTWSIKHGKDASFLEYFQDILTHLGVTITTAAITDFPNFYTRPTFCFRSPVMYHFEPSTYYGLVLSLLVPLLWWVVTWITSLYKTNGISRGNSQVALLVTGLTPAVAEKLRGYSHAGQSALFKRARQVQAVFGETKAGSDRRGHVAFGTKEEMNSIRPRRSSIDSRI